MTVLGFKEIVKSKIDLLIVLVILIFSWGFSYGLLNSKVAMIQESVNQLAVEERAHESNTAIHVDPIRDKEWRDLVISNLEEIKAELWKVRSK